MTDSAHVVHMRIVTYISNTLQHKMHIWVEIAYKLFRLKFANGIVWLPMETQKIIIYPSKNCLTNFDKFSSDSAMLKFRLCYLCFFGAAVSGTFS